MLVDPKREHLKDLKFSFKKVSNKTYDAIRLNVKNEFDSCEFISYTIDCWAGLDQNFIRFQ